VFTDSDLSIPNHTHKAYLPHSAKKPLMQIESALTNQRTQTVNCRTDGEGFTCVYS